MDPFFETNPRGSKYPIWGVPKIRGTFLGGPYNKDYSILGSRLGSPYFGRLPYLRTLAPTTIPLIPKYCVLGPSRKHSELFGCTVQ